MHILDTEFSDVKIIISDIRTDPRGSMEITLGTDAISAHGIAFRCAEQRIYRMPRKGTFFGIHYQMGDHPQSKLIRLLNGRGLDYVIDLQKDSATYGKWIAVELSGCENKSIYIPHGYGHAFISLEDNTTQLFSVSEKYLPGESGTIRFSDPQIDLSLPTEITAISDRDRYAPYLIDLESDNHR